MVGTHSNFLIAYCFFFWGCWVFIYFHWLIAIGLEYSWTEELLLFTPFCFWRGELFNSSGKYWQSVRLVTRTTSVLGWPHVAGKIGTGISPELAGCSCGGTRWLGKRLPERGSSWSKPCPDQYDLCHNTERMDLGTGVKKVTRRIKWVHLFKVVNYR